MQHDFNSVREDFLLKWNSCSESIRVQTANLFFQERRKGYQQSWLSFINRQDKNHLPSLPAGKRVVAYFSSSDDEYAAVEDLVIWDRWPNQLTAVKELIKLISKNTDLFLVIRLHPHKAEKNLTDLKEWLTLPFAENVLLIPPNDPVDTYALIERADVVVTSGSTVGIESVFWGTPSICLGPSLYSHLDAVYLPANQRELESLLLDSSLQVNSEKSLPYGYYMSIFGEEFVYYKAESLFSGKFMNVNLQFFGLCKYLRFAFTLPIKIVSKVLKFYSSIIQRKL